MPQDEKSYFELDDTINNRKIRVPKFDPDDAPQPEIQIDNEGNENLLPLASELLSKAQHAILVFQKIGLSADTKNCNQALNEAVKFINREINEIADNNEFKKKSTAEKNKHLDKLRPKLTQMVLDHVESTLKIKMDSKHPKFKEWKQAWKTLPSNYYKIQRTDKKNNIQSTITGSKNSSHNKAEWQDSSAWRKITLEKTSPERPSQDEKSNDLIFYRVPSLANLKADEDTDITAIAARIREIHENADDKQSKPLFYNLVTSLHDQSNPLEGIADFFKNQQNASAERIFLGVHKYNRVIYNYNVSYYYHFEKSKQHSKHYCYVQNLGVNMHSANLSNDSMSETVREATLLADLSFVNNLFANDDTVETSVQLINYAYDQFLSSPPNDSFFHSTTEGKKCINEINLFKNNIKNFLPKTLTSASDLLKHAFAKNLHYDQELGNIIQTLSILSQHENGHISMGGCKSANERLENVLNQVYMEYSNNSLSKTDKKVEIDKKFFLELSDKFNKAVNDNGGYTPINMISITDNGPSKLKKMKPYLKTVRNGFFFLSAILPAAVLIGLNLTAYIPISIVLGIIFHGLSMDTNNAASTVLTNQSSKNASKTQTHKMYKSELLKSVKKLLTNPLFLTTSSVLCLAILFNQGVINPGAFATLSKEIAANFVPVVAITASILSIITIYKAYKSKEQKHRVQILNKVLPTALASATVISLQVLIGTNILTLATITSPTFIALAATVVVLFSALSTILNDQSAKKFALSDQEMRKMQADDLSTKSPPTSKVEDKVQPPSETPGPTLR